MVRSYQDLVGRFSVSSREARSRCVNLGIRKFPAAADKNYELAVKILGDHDFMVSHMMAVWGRSQHASVYAYVFSDESAPGSTVAGHGADQKYLWGTQPIPGDGNQRPADISATIMEAWASLPWNGDPSTPTLGT